MPARNHAVKFIDVLMELDLLKPRRREEALNRRCLVILHFDRQNSAGHEPPGCPIDHFSNDF